MTTSKTGERMLPELYRSEADYILYLRHLWLARLRHAPALASWAHQVADLYATPEDRDAGCDLLAICRR